MQKQQESGKTPYVLSEFHTPLQEGPRTAWGIGPKLLEVGEWELLIGDTGDTEAEEPSDTHCLSEITPKPLHRWSRELPKRKKNVLKLHSKPGIQEHSNMLSQSTHPGPELCPEGRP